MSRSRFPIWPQAKLDRLLRRWSTPERLPYTWETDRAFARIAAWTRNRYVPNWLSGDPRDVDTDLEDWTHAVWGWTLPCREVIDVLSRVIPSDDFRIIDVGAGRGNWTRLLSGHFGQARVVGIEPRARGPLLRSMTFQDWLDENGPLLKRDIVFLSYPPCTGQAGSQLSVEVIDAMVPGQWLLYLGEGPRGAAGTPEFHRRLSQEYAEWTTVPIPSESPSRLPRPWARMLVKHSPDRQICSDLAASWSTR